ncbi:hypothetical protein QJQ45_021512, partial [Haematococcus lacustris]
MPPTRTDTPDHSAAWGEPPAPSGAAGAPPFPSAAAAEQQQQQQQQDSSHRPCTTSSEAPLALQALALGSQLPALCPLPQRCSRLFAQLIQRTVLQPSAGASATLGQVLASVQAMVGSGNLEAVPQLLCAPLGAEAGSAAAGSLKPGRQGGPGLPAGSQGVAAAPGAQAGGLGGSGGSGGSGWVGVEADGGQWLQHQVQGAGAGEAALAAQVLAEGGLAHCTPVQTATAGQRIAQLFLHRTALPPAAFLRAISQLAALRSALNTRRSLAAPYQPSLLDRRPDTHHLRLLAAALEPAMKAAGLLGLLTAQEWEWLGGPGGAGVGVGKGAAVGAAAAGAGVGAGAASLRSSDSVHLLSQADRLPLLVALFQCLAHCSTPQLLSLGLKATGQTAGSPQHLTAEAAAAPLAGYIGPPLPLGANALPSCPAQLQQLQVWAWGASGPVSVPPAAQAQLATAWLHLTALTTSHLLTTLAPPPPSPQTPPPTCQGLQQQGDLAAATPPPGHTTPGSPPPGSAACRPLPPPLSCNPGPAAAAGAGAEVSGPGAGQGAGLTPLQLSQVVEGAAGMLSAALPSRSTLGQAVAAVLTSASTALNRVVSGAADAGAHSFAPSSPRSLPALAMASSGGVEGEQAAARRRSLLNSLHGLEEEGRLQGAAPAGALSQGGRRKQR